MGLFFFLSDRNISKTSRIDAGTQINGICRAHKVTNKNKRRYCLRYAKSAK